MKKEGLDLIHVIQARSSSQKVIGGGYYDRYLEDFTGKTVK